MKTLYKLRFSGEKSMHSRKKQINTVTVTLLEYGKLKLGFLPSLSRMQINQHKPERVQFATKKLFQVF